MTKSEIYAAWERYMHRNDLAADLDTTYLLTEEKIEQSLLVDVDLTEGSEDHTRAGPMYLHYGLHQLHELAQDDAGAQREMGLFGQCKRDFTMFKLRQDNPVPQMQDGYYGT